MKDITLKKNDGHVRRHDVFNFVFIGLILILDSCFLMSYEDNSNLINGNNQHTYFVVFNSLFYTFLLGTLFDLMWIYYIPTSVLGERNGILLHHILTLVMCAVPMFAPQFEYYFCILLLVEFNTFLIVLKRWLIKGSLLGRLCELLFYSTWVGFRLVMFPVLIKTFIWEYIDYSEKVGTYSNVALLGPVVLSIITAMGFKWTADLLSKSIFKRRSS